MPSVQDTRTTTTTRRPGLRRRVRGKVMVLLCIFYALAYIDRSNISTAAPFIHTDLNLSDAQMGLVFSAFALPYAFLQMPGGWLGDRFGARRTLAWLGGVWAAATAATGAAGGLGTLVASRLALGAGESAAFPTATTAMSRWLPAQPARDGPRTGPRRLPAAAARWLRCSSGRSSPPPRGGCSFYVVGGLSLIWTIVWLAYFRDRPKDHVAVTSARARGAGPGRRGHRPAHRHPVAHRRPRPAPGRRRRLLLRLVAVGLHHLAAHGVPGAPWAGRRLLRPLHEPWCSRPGRSVPSSVAGSPTSSCAGAGAGGRLGCCPSSSVSADRSSRWCRP